MGYKDISSGNIKDCLNTDDDYAEWYIDKYGDFRADTIHHDGTNHYLYRVFKDNLSETQMENLRNKIYNNKVKALENQYKDDVKTYLYKRLDVDRTYCKKMREMFDSWLGEGTSQKVFGSKNRIGMFDEFYNQLVPILNDIQLNFEQIKENLLKRYNPEVKL